MVRYWNVRGGHCSRQNVMGLLKIWIKIVWLCYIWSYCWRNNVSWNIWKYFFLKKGWRVVVEMEIEKGKQCFAEMQINELKLDWMEINIFFYLRYFTLEWSVGLDMRMCKKCVRFNMNLWVVVWDPHLKSTMARCQEYMWYLKHI